jgi:carbon monoxide dehydrogenase subunit G
MRWVLMGPVVLVLGVILMFVIGYFRPKTRIARSRSRLSSPPAAAWTIISDYERWAEWQPSLQRVERLPDTQGPLTLITEGASGEIPMRIEEMTPPSRMITFLDSGMFRGRWTWELSPSGDGGTDVTITEEAEIDNPFFRSLLMFHDNYRAQFELQRALARRLGESVEPVRLD